MARELLIDVPTKEYLESLVESALGKNGKEYPNPTKLFVKGLDYPLTLKEQIKRIIRQEFSQKAIEQGFESFEEANDFEVGDDEPRSNYELMEDEEPVDRPTQVEAPKEVPTEEVAPDQEADPDEIKE